MAKFYVEWREEYAAQLIVEAESAEQAIEKVQSSDADTIDEVFIASGGPHIEYIQDIPGTYTAEEFVG